MAQQHRDTPRRFAVPDGFHIGEPPRGGGAARVAVLGRPIAHSKSPELHLAAYWQLGLDWEYRRWELPVDGLATALRSRGQGWRGFSVTAPFKGEALAFCDEASEDAIRSGAVNTIVFDSLEPGAYSRGENTDIAGTVAAFVERGVPRVDGRVDVLGSGNTAASLAIAAQRLGATEVRIWARRPDAAAALAKQLGPDVTAADLANWQLEPGTAAVLDTIPGGYALAPQQVADARIPSTPLFSAAYAPWPTPLAARWLAVGGTVVTGLDMLLHQAVRQVRLFTGRDAEEPLPNEARVLAAMRKSIAA